MFRFEFYRTKADFERGVFDNTFNWAGDSPLDYLAMFQRTSKICVAYGDNGLVQIFEQKRGRWNPARFGRPR